MEKLLSNNYCNSNDWLPAACGISISGSKDPPLLSTNPSHSPLQSFAPLTPHHY